MKTIRFSAADLEVFSSASHDRSPLHMSDEYARRTAYGSRVVFGILNLITALAHARVPDRRDCILSSIECEFFDIAQLGIDYQVALEETASESTLRINDGRRPVLEAILRFRPGRPQAIDQTEILQPRLSNPKDLNLSDLSIGQRILGRYAPCLHQLAALRARAGLHYPWATTREISALLWASYLVGMEVPGKRALFSRLRIEFQPSVQAAAPFEYEVNMREINDVGELTLDATLSSAGKEWAKAEISAYLRGDLPTLTTANMEKLVGRSESLAGRTAFVSGGSRGLGAALVRALALHGCTVLLNFRHGQSEAEQIGQSLAQSPGKVVLEPGDIADVQWCLELHERLRRNQNALNFLFCNASPALVPLWLEPCASTRVNDFITRSLAMVTAPTCALVPLVADTRGWYVLVSSTAVTQMHPYFPHYVAAKCGAEALVRAAAAEYRTVSSLIVRPARLLTDMTNTPLGRRGAVPPEIVAAAALKRLLGTPCPGKVEVLEQFESA